MNSPFDRGSLPIAVASTAVILTCFPGCSDPSTDKPQTGSPTVATVNYPLAYFAERIGGDTIAVEFPAIDGDPTFWEPQTADIQTYQQADLILLNGANYAKWVPKVSLSQAKLVNTSAALTKKLIPLTDEVTHTHGPGGEHAHGDTAFTTWLDPQLATAQAAAIRDAMAAKWPQHQADIFPRCRCRQWPGNRRISTGRGRSAATLGCTGARARRGVGTVYRFRPQIRHPGRDRSQAP